MESFKYKKTRIWELKEDKYAKSHAKNQVCPIFRMRDIRKDVLPKFIKLWACVKNLFLTIKVDKCDKNKHDAGARKLSKVQEKVRGMLKAEFMEWLFGFSIIKLSFQLRYYRMNNTSKRDISFIYAEAWHATQNRTFRSDLLTLTTLKICQYHSPWVTKPVLCPFLNHWIYFWIVFRVFRAQLGLICDWQIQVWPCLSVKDIDEQCEFSQSPR